MNLTDAVRQSRNGDIEPTPPTALDDTDAAKRT